MALQTTSVNRSLDRKLKIAGFEVPDLLAIFLLLALLNFLFAGSAYKIFLSWLPTLLIAVVIRLGKRGKPENYLLHLARFHLNPKYYPAFPEPNYSPRILRSIKRTQDVKKIAR